MLGSHPIVRLETAKHRHKVFDLAGRRGFTGFKIALEQREDIFKQETVRTRAQSFSLFSGPSTRFDACLVQLARLFERVL